MNVNDPERALTWFLRFAVGFALLVVAYALVIIALGVVDSFHPL
jgi:hypothetical protein